MTGFLQRHREHVTGVLNGFDRIRFRGSLRAISFTKGLSRLLGRSGVLLKNAGDFFEDIKCQIQRFTAEEAVKTHGLPPQYVSCGSVNKEAVALAIAAEKGITQGPVCTLGAKEMCQSFAIRRDGGKKILELVPAKRPGLHYYHYLIHPVLGWMSVRVQTWMPLTVWVCINGREYLQRRMDEAGLKYRRRDNCFCWLEDLQQSQALLDGMLHLDWASQLEEVVGRYLPPMQRLFPAWQPHYYWTISESEWATDVMFESSATLARLYPPLVRHAICNLDAADVLRFMGRTHPHLYRGQQQSNLGAKVQGVRVKHCVGKNSIKIYDKQETVLRVETTINDPRAIKTYRRAEGAEDEAAKSWLPLRKAVADIERRAEVSQQANGRYLEAMGSVEVGGTLKQMCREVCQAVVWEDPKSGQRRRARALNPIGAQDGELLEAVSDGAYALQGFRNRDIRQKLFGDEPADAAGRKKQTAKVTRLIGILRAHGLVKKVNKTHRYQLSSEGRRVITALLAARAADTAKLAAAA